MRKLAFLTLLCALLFLLSCCGFTKEVSDKQSENTLPEAGSTVVTEEPAAVEETTEETIEETVEETIADTVPPTEPTPMTPVPYLKDTAAEACIFKEPNNRSEFVRVFGHEGVYTVVEEQYDDNGHLWGKLKSGIGWINLTEPFCGGPDVPKVIASYTSQEVLEGDYHLAGLFTGDEYRVNVTVLAHETVYNVRISEYNLIEARAGTPLYTLEVLEPQKPLVAHLIFPGDMSAYLVSYIDADGMEHSFELCMSMDDSNTIARFW